MRTHVFVPDGQTHVDRVERCADCCFPKRNVAAHGVPDKTTEQAEHRRRAGEGEAA